MVGRHFDLEGRVRLPIKLVDHNTYLAKDRFEGKGHLAFQDLTCKGQNFNWVGFKLKVMDPFCPYTEGTVQIVDFSHRACTLSLALRVG